MSAPETTLVSWDYVRKYEDMCRQLIEVATFLDRLAHECDLRAKSFTDPWLAVPDEQTSLRCRAMAARLRGET